MSNGIDVKSIANFFQNEVTEKVANFIELDTEKRARSAGRRAKLVKNRHSAKTYRYSNTGQLANAIRKVKNGKGYIVDAGTRADYSSGYHGMYFLVEKQGERDADNILKASKKYTEALKL